MTQTVFEKIWASHQIADLGDRTGLLLIDRVFLHERTGSVAMQGLRAAGRTVNAPRQTFVTMDHVVDTRPGRTDATIMPTGKDFIVATRQAAQDAGLTLFDLGDPRQGIVHVISPEQGIVLPGLTLVCPDSHTCTQGALGALAWGIGSTEAEHALVTSTLRVSRPKTLRIMVSGRLRPGVTPKDMALYLLAKFGVGGARGHCVEYAGEAVRALEVEGRLTLCNMATELSAFSGLIAADDTVFEYLHGRPYAPSGAGWEAGLAAWRQLVSDDEAVFDAELSADASQIDPMITWGNSPQQATSVNGLVPGFAEVAHRETREGYDRALNYMGLVPGQALSNLPIDGAFIGSCTNARLTDLIRAAAVLKGRKVAPNVRAICVPGSMRVKAEAEALGLDLIFREAGFEWREAGCSMCFYSGGESYGFQQRVVTSTNRNFESRQGPQTRSHLASPETVAASALAGFITDPRKLTT